MSNQEPSRLSEAKVRRIRSTGDLPVAQSPIGPSRIPDMGGETTTSGQTQGRLSHDPQPPSLRPPEPQQEVRQIPFIPIPRPQQSHQTPNNPNSGNVPSSAAGTPTLVQPPPPNQPVAQQIPQGRFRRFLAHLGIGRTASRERKAKLSLVYNLSWGFAQIVVITTLLSLTGTVWKSPTYPDLTEWKACDKPLGVWACLWMVRVVSASGLAYWEYVRSLENIRQQANNASAPPGNPTTTPTLYPPPLDMRQDPTYIQDPWAVPTQSNLANTNNPANPQNNPVRYHPLYSKLTLFSTLLTLSWFLTAHILQYTSLNTCRYYSPHLWWLTFGILCIMYLMVLEVIILGFIVLILAPILFILWNIFLFIIGRHPAQNPHMIKPDIGKLPKSVVDRIPLVMYIPPPPNASGSSETAPTPAAEYDYPPKPPAPSKKSRFRWFKRKPSKQKEGTSETGPVDALATDLEKGQTDQEIWEGHFEKGEYPFVVLEGNRAICAICLMDFEEPPRKIVLNLVTANDNQTSPEEQNKPDNAGGSSNNAIEERPELKLTDAGEGAQPLRLLACGHVFHQTCLDPWLIDVSGRCPVCQRAVEAKELKKKRRPR